MINLDQVKTLEWKVKQAVQLVVHLRRENDTLRGRLSDTEVRLQDLEATLSALKANQTEMESGIRSALEELDHLEGAEAPQSVQVDPVSFPPETVSKPVAPEETSDAEARAFEEEFAALAAAEEAAKAAAIAEEVAQAAEEASAAVPGVPASVELEDEPADPVVSEEQQPEQPGLGIF